VEEMEFPWTAVAAAGAKAAAGGVIMEAMCVLLFCW
jgi:hypothetical protein